MNFQPEDINPVMPPPYASRTREFGQRRYLAHVSDGNLTIWDGYAEMVVSKITLDGLDAAAIAVLVLNSIGPLIEEETRENLQEKINEAFREA